MARSELMKPIAIEGLAEAARSLRKLDSDLPKGLRLAQNEAGQLIVDHAKPQVPKDSGRAASTIKAKSTRTEGRVVGGSARYPYYPWLDFGGAVGKGDTVRRPYYSEGRYLYPALAAKREDVQDALLRALLQVCRDAGVDVE